MIRVEPPAGGLTAAERYGLDAILDLSGLLRVDDPSSPVVTLTVTSDAIAATAVASGEAGRIIERSDGAIRLPRALLQQVTAIAGAGTEQRVTISDRQGRVPSAANPLVGARTERRPVVSELGRSVREAVRAAAGRRPVRGVAPWPDRRRWAVACTHDVDVVNGWPLFTALRLLELVRAGEGRRAAKAAVDALGAALGSPAQAGVAGVLAMEAAWDVRSTWFLLCGTPTLDRWRAGDVTYDVGSAAGRRVVHAVQERRHEIGVHGTFATATDPAAFRRERLRLAQVTGSSGASGIRQHFLKMRPGDTQRRMREAGFAYDATYGFPDRNGFRLGVADVVGGWDERAGEPTELDEVPLHWMDRAQSKYQGVEDPRAWVRDALELAARCREVEGLWVGLWHPNLTGPLGYPEAPEAYAELLRALGEDAERPAVDTLEQLVAWRRRRRGARARRVGPDGSVEWESPPVPLEDGDGRPVA